MIIAPDGKTAWALRFGDGKVTKLTINGDQLSRVTDYAVGKQPDGGIMTADGRYLINNNFGGVPGHTDKGATVGARHQDRPDRRRAGSGRAARSMWFCRLTINIWPWWWAMARPRSGTQPNYNSVFGKLVIFRLDKGKLIHVTDGQLGHACQGAVWSDDGKCAAGPMFGRARHSSISISTGQTLTKDDSATLKFESRPGAIVTAKTR